MPEGFYPLLNFPQTSHLFILQDGFTIVRMVLVFIEKFDRIHMKLVLIKKEFPGYLPLQTQKFHLFKIVLIGKMHKISIT